MHFNEFLDSQKSKKPHYLLIGNPVGHSVSPIMHNYALDFYAKDAEYIAVSVGLTEMDVLLNHLRGDNFLGANITIPHKETLFSKVDSLSPEAAEVGAINTIIKSGTSTKGDNTDAYGFMAGLNPYLKNSKIELDTVIIFGSGGATKAIIYALVDKGVNQIVLVSRRPELFGEESSEKIIRCNYEQWQKYAYDAQVIINATPLGMQPNVDASPVKKGEEKFLSGKICYDIVYNPRNTTFLKQAKSVETIGIGGLEMLIQQGAKSFELWTGLPFPVKEIREKLNEVFPA